MHSMTKIDTVENSLYRVTADQNYCVHLGEKITKQSGLLPTFIHPLFRQHRAHYGDKTKSHIEEVLRVAHQSNEESRRHETKDPNVTELNEAGYLLRLVHFLADTPKDLLLLGEEDEFLLLTIALFREIGYQGEILYYPTQSGDPRPEADFGTYEDISKAIALLHPQTLVVGGQLTLQNPRDLLRTYGCVPSFVHHIQSFLPSTELKVTTAKITTVSVSSPMYQVTALTNMSTKTSGF